jgi:hypothetical protein
VVGVNDATNHGGVWKIFHFRVNDATNHGGVLESFVIHY